MDPFRLRSLPTELDSQIPAITPVKVGPMERRTKETGIEKPASQTIAIRLPESLLSEIKELARHKDIAFQNLIKNMLLDQLALEQKKNS